MIKPQCNFNNNVPEPLHPLNPKYQDIVLNKDIEYRIVGVVMDKKKKNRCLSGPDERLSPRLFG